MRNLFPDFLVDPVGYARAERFWEDLWDRVAPFHRERLGWSSPWLGTGSPAIKDGNPIFSAHSPALRRGIRVIQEEPIGAGLDIRIWLDTFGGDITDPDRIHELVISCVLSDVAARIASDLMSSWARGEAITFGAEAGMLLPRGDDEPRRNVRALDFAA